MSDNGIGLDQLEQHDIFDEFVRGQGAIDRGTAGVGLGLALVRAIMRANRGKIDVTSQKGVGTSFRLRLPKGRLEKTEPALVENRESVA